MTFFVEKKLALGSIRFGSQRRRTAESIDSRPELSTGPLGDFVRRRNEGFYFGGQDRFDKPSVPDAPSIRSTPFMTSLSENKAFLAIATVGTFIVLVGLVNLVKANVGPGVLALIVVLIIAGIPMFLTAQTRGRIRAEEERKRVEREETENRKRQMLAGYTAALERVQNDRTEDAMQLLVNEHPDLPYNLWSPSARRVVLLIGFDELAKRGDVRRQRTTDREPVGNRFARRRFNDLARVPRPQVGVCGGRDHADHPR